jgi:hypothetical protein
MVATGLRLDDLELGSLRGELTDMSLEVDLVARGGAGRVRLGGLRYLGLQADSLSCRAR